MKKITKYSLLFSSIIILTQLTGCALFHPQNTAVITPDRQPLENLSLLSEQAARATQSLAATHNTMANASMTKNQRVKSYYQATFTSRELNQPMTFYSETMTEARKILMQLFLSAQWKFSTYGKSPAIPIMVSIEGKDKPIIHYIHDIDAQLGSRATLHMYPASKMAVLAYNKEVF